MKFTSYISIAYLAIFLPAVILLYTILPKKVRPFVLLAASFTFFWFISEWLICYILISIVSIYLIALWLNKLKDKHITNEKLAEIIGMESTVAVSNLLNQKNNPSTHYRDVISKEFNITFDYIKIKDLILTISHISDRKISTNCKRVLFLLLLLKPTDIKTKK